MAEQSKDFLASFPTETGEGILTITGNTDKTFYPRRLVTGKTGQTDTAVYSSGNDIHEEFNTYSKIKITLSNATQGKGVTAHILVEEFRGD